MEKIKKKYYPLLPFDIKEGKYTDDFHAEETEYYIPVDCMYALNVLFSLTSEMFHIPVCDLARIQRSTDNLVWAIEMKKVESTLRTVNKFSSTFTK